MSGTVPALLLAAALALIQPAPLRILFVGNSLTVRQRRAGPGRGHRPGQPASLVCEHVTAPDLSLEDHWRQGHARQAIASGGWDFVVLQQGPSALPDSRALLVDYARRFDKAVRSAGATTALYMVWPSQARRGDFPEVSRSYAAAAEPSAGCCCRSATHGAKPGGWTRGCRSTARTASTPPSWARNWPR